MVSLLHVPFAVGYQGPQGANFTIGWRERNSLMQYAGITEFQSGGGGEAGMASTPVSTDWPVRCPGAASSVWLTSLVWLTSSVWLLGAMCPTAHVYSGEGRAAD